MKMEDIKLAVYVMKRKPPTELPPFLEKMSKEAQYIDDAKTAASTSLERIVMAKLATMTNVSYSPNITKSTKDQEIQKYFLQKRIKFNVNQKIACTYQTRHPRQ